MQETWVRSLRWEDPLEKEMATHSTILAWRILAGYSPWGHKESDMTDQLHFLSPPKVRNLGSRNNFLRQNKETYHNHGVTLRLRA